MLLPWIGETATTVASTTGGILLGLGVVVFLLGAFVRESRIIWSGLVQRAFVGTSLLILSEVLGALAFALAIVVAVTKEVLLAEGTEDAVRNALWVVGFGICIGLSPWPSVIIVLTAIIIDLVASQVATRSVMWTAGFACVVNGAIFWQTYKTSSSDLDAHLGLWRQRPSSPSLWPSPGVASAL